MTLGLLVCSLSSIADMELTMTWMPRSPRSSLPVASMKTLPTRSPVCSSTSPSRAAAHSLYALGKTTSVTSPSMSSKVTMAI